MIKALFCKTCHVFISNYIQDKDGTQMLKNGKPVGGKFKGNIFTVRDGKKMCGLPVRCRAGHLNYIEDSQECIDEGIRLQYSYGKPCAYHDVPETICNVRCECKDCTVWKNYKELKL